MRDLADTDPDLTPPSAMLADEARQSWGARIADDVAATHELVRETREDARRIDERCDRIERRLGEVVQLLRSGDIAAARSHAEILDEVREHRQATEAAAVAAKTAAERAEEAASRLQ